MAMIARISADALSTFAKGDCADPTIRSHLKEIRSIAAKRT
jgi:hypothetical protein